MSTSSMQYQHCLHQCHFLEMQFFLGNFKTQFLKAGYCIDSLNAFIFPLILLSALLMMLFQ